MTQLISSINEIVQVLSFYADRLNYLRGIEEAHAVRGYLSADDAEMCWGAIQPWYKTIEPIYAELEKKMQDAGADGHDIAENSELKPFLDKLHRLRAAYEFDKEMREAANILAQSDPAQALNAFLSHQAYWALSEPVADALKNAEKVAVVGSGPLPLTALSIAANVPCQITCYEIDKDAFEHGSQILAHSPLSERIESKHVEGFSADELNTYDVVFAAVLIGVHLADENHDPKGATIENFFTKVKPGFTLILREPFRLGKLFYPATQLSGKPGTTVNRYDPDPKPGEPYRSSTLIFKKD